MGQNDKCSWGDRKAALNIENHGYDFADLEEVFDGRFLLIRQVTRENYGELRYNALAEYSGCVINITVTPRAGKIHLISVRPASRQERKVYYDKNPHS